MMRKIWLVFTALSVSLSAVANTGADLNNNVHKAQPVKSHYFNQQYQHNALYIPLDHSEIALQNLANSVSRHFDPVTTKEIRVVWSEKKALKTANKLAGVLKKKRKLPAKLVKVKKSTLKRDSHPVYVEVVTVAAKKVRCRVQTAEDFMSFDPYVPCASDSNHLQQLRNK